MKRIAVAIVFLALCFSSLSACTRNPADPEATGSGASENNQSAEKLNVISNGKSEYVLVRPDDADSDLIERVKTLRNEIKEACGVELMIKSDFEASNATAEERHRFEILVGGTNRDESSEALAGKKYNDCVISVIGDRVVINGGCPDALYRAIDTFVAEYVKAEGISLDKTLNEQYDAVYAKSKLTVDGADISAYRIVYDSKYKSTAKALAERIGMLCGVKPEISSDLNTETEREIVIGSARRGVTGTYGYDDFSIYENGDSIMIGAGSENALGAACGMFLDNLKSGGEALDFKDVTAVYTAVDRQEYIDDITKLIPHWSVFLDVPEWMLDFNEKYAAILDADGRMMSCLHRGDCVYYPENSIEALISAVRMGADMIEIDPRLTRDGVLVLMHDATLTRMTDFAAKAGKNGLPTSSNICDWSYDELQQLNLKSQRGGSTATVTPYKIPTLEEAIKVCAEKLFLRLDYKTDTQGNGFWNYEKDVWPLIVSYKAYSTVIFTWHSQFYANDYSTVKTYKQKMIEASGRASVAFLGSVANQTGSMVYQMMKLYGLECIRLNDFNMSETSYKTYLEKNSQKLKSLYGKGRMYVDANGTNAKYPENVESVGVWEELAASGINILLVDNGFLICNHIAKTCSPTAY